MGGIFINGMTNLVRVSSFEVFHVLSVVDKTVTDATHLAVSSVIVLGQALARGRSSPVSSRGCDLGFFLKS